MGESERHLRFSFLSHLKNGGKMVKGISKKDQVLLLISNHKILSGISACIQCVLLKMGFNKRYSQMIKEALDTFLEKMGGVLLEYIGIYYTAAFAI